MSKNSGKIEENELLAMRHSAEHVLTMAMLRIWGNKIKAAMGPATDEGFYFDFDSEEKISEEDFQKIETEMQKIIKEDLPITKDEMTVADAVKFFNSNIYHGNEYKHEWLSEIKSRGEKVSVYWMGEKGKDIPETFVDICAGPHVDSTGKIGPFKLLSVAGAYWHGDERNKMLTRIYGTAFRTKKELDKHLWRLEEARKRDHKKLGRELDLFIFSDLVGPGLPLWTPKGTILRNLLDDYVWDLRRTKGYEKVTIPHITKKELYETSGHWSKFENELFKIQSREDHLFAMKPMNCPHHTQIFAHVPRSYHDMPQRYAETTMCYRDEQTGELSGLSRVRSFTQDDAHVFCRKDQIKEEFTRIWDIVNTFYRTFGFDLMVRLSLHDPANMKAYLGTPEMWQEAESSIRTIAKERDTSYSEAVGEAAFYGPKIDFMANDSLGRQWQVATIQLDINMPERFNLFCINEKGEEERIVMIHAAIMGSIERFLSILIEHFAGAFPAWLAPVQVKVIPVSEKSADYADKVVKILTEAQLRVEVADSNMTLGKNIREAQTQKIPYMLIVGPKEEESNTVSVRSREKGDLGALPLEKFVIDLKTEIADRRGEH